jgi:hypothetical protein
MLSIIFQAKSEMGGHPIRPKSIANIAKNTSTELKNCQQQEDPFNRARSRQNKVTKSSYNDETVMNQE